MKIISLNLEGKKHLAMALPFLQTQAADVVCLMEASKDLEEWLVKQGYFVTFAPMVLRNHDGLTYESGIIFASKQAHRSEIFYYRQPTPEIVLFDTHNKRESISHPVIWATSGDFNFATTHFTWNPNGETADQNQTTDLTALLAYLQTKPPHVLCGDFNIPRNINALYQELRKAYTDNIPLDYRSSLDADHHRAGKDSSLDKLFTQFMVDYAFTQAPYVASDVRLQFGVSDHAAVVATITRP